MRSMGIHPDKPEQTGLHYMKVRPFANWFFRVSPNKTEQRAVMASRVAW